MTAETNRLRVMPVANVPEGEVRRFASPGRRTLAVYNVGGEILVTDDVCTHGLASLAEGFLDGDTIECPWHGGAFNVRTGAATRLPCSEPLRTYAASVEDGFVWVTPDPIAKPRQSKQPPIKGEPS